MARIDKNGLIISRIEKTTYEQNTCVEAISAKYIPPSRGIQYPAFTSQSILERWNRPSIYAILYIYHLQRWTSNCLFVGSTTSMMIYIKVEGSEKNNCNIAHRLPPGHSSYLSSSNYFLTSRQDVDGPLLHIIFQ